jgi:hypothetical protein
MDVPYAGNAAIRRSGVPEQYLIDFLTMWLVRESQLRFL